MFEIIILFQYFEKKTTNKLEFEEITEEDVYEFFFKDDIVKLEGNNINIFFAWKLI